VFGSLPLGSIAGITIRVHVLLLAVLGWLVLALHEEVERALLSAAFVLGAVLAHELGHAIAARRLGVPVRGITLGVVSMTHLEVPESSRIEAIVALSGPVVNLALAGVAWFAWQTASTSGTAPRFVTESLFAALVSNAALGTLNLVPAFPADGGRVLRATLASRLGWLRGTEVAFAVTRVVAVLVAGFGIASGQWLLVLVSAWIWWLGAREVHAVRLRHAPDARTWMREMFGRMAAGAFGAGASQAPSQASPRSSSRPSSTPPDAAPRPSGRGYRDEDVERLERFRGPLEKFEP
jgi:Zn-dependent protease